MLNLGMKGCVVLCCLLGAAAHEGARKGEDRDGRVRTLNDNLRVLENRRGSDAYTPAAARNGIDAVTFAKMQADGVPVNGLCDDGVFLRRVSLLLTGRLPDPDAARAFLASDAADKRAAMIDTLLESEAYRTRMTFYFQEHFQSAPIVLRAGQPLYNAYLADAVTENKPLNTMARELMTGLGLTDQVGTANYFAAGGGNTRLQQDFWDNVAVFTGSKMLGVPLECISCHDGAYHLEDINLYLADKKREDFWQMAAWYSSVARRLGTRNAADMVVSLNFFRQSGGYLAQSDSGDRPVRDGGLVTPRYLMDGSTPEGADWMTELADKVVADRQFARNWANRLWGHLFGLAMVEPMDGFDLNRISADAVLPEGWDLQVLDPALLDHMTDSLIGFGFDTKAYLRYVLNSATFQMDSQWQPGVAWQAGFSPYYTRYLPRHMTSEEVYDSVMSGMGLSVPIAQVYFGGVRAPSVSYAHAFIDTLQPRRGNTEVRNFLDIFGRGNRFDQPRTNQGGIAQALMLMNSPVVNNPFLLRDGRIRAYVDQGMEAPDIIDALYVDLYARHATADETADMLAALAGFDDPADRATTVLWLLINQVAFTFIY